MPRWLSTVLGITALVAGLGVAFFLYSKTNEVDFDSHLAVAEGVRDAQHQNAVLKEQVLAVRYGLLRQYDSLTRSEEQLRGTVADLEQSMEAVVGQSPELSEAFVALTSTLQSREQDVERFKMQNAILGNSLRYLPLAARRLEDATTQAELENAAELNRGAQRLVELTLTYSLLVDPSVRKRHEAKVAELRKLSSGVPGELQLDYSLLLTHAETVTAQQGPVDELVTSLNDEALEDRLVTLDEAYQDRFQAALTASSRYRSILIGWSVFLLLGLITAGGKLRQMYANLERLVADRTRELKEAVDELWGEMELAKKIQTALVPSAPALPGCEVAAFMDPAAKVGGDYYDVVSAGGKDWVLIGDVAGHGVPAGLIMMMSQTAVRSVLERDPDVTPARLLASVNEVITQNIDRLGEQDKYMTMTALCRSGNKFQFAGLHQDLFIYRAERDEVERIESSGMWIGMRPDIESLLDVREFDLAPGDALLLYTDGLTEARDRATGGLLDNDGVSAALHEVGNRPAPEIIAHLREVVGRHEVRDDVAAVVVKQLPA